MSTDFWWGVFTIPLVIAGLALANAPIDDIAEKRGKQMMRGKEISRGETVFLGDDGSRPYTVVHTESTTIWIVPAGTEVRATHKGNVYNRDGEREWME